MKNSPVPQAPQKERRPLSEEAYTFGSPWTATETAGTMAHAIIGAPDCLRQSLQWQIVLRAAWSGISN